MSGKKSSTESLTGKKSSDSVTDKKSSEEKNISKTKSKENIVPKSTEVKKAKSLEKVGKSRSLEIVKKTSSENSGSKVMLRTKSNESIGKGRRSKSRENLSLEVKSTGKIGDLNIKTSKEDVNSQSAVKSPGPPNTEKGKDSRRSGEGYDTSGFSMAFGENSLRSRSASESESTDGKVESKDENDKGQQGRERRVAFRGVPPTMDEKMTRQSSNVLLNKFWPQRADSTDSVNTQSNRQTIILSVAVCFFSYALYKIILFYFGALIVSIYIQIW